MAIIANIILNIIAGIVAGDGLSLDPCFVPTVLLLFLLLLLLNEKTIGSLWEELSVPA